MALANFPASRLRPTRCAEWYAPHAAAWARLAKPNTTLWFWNSEIGWAKAHPALELNGWRYEETVVWDKGIAHIAGNVNSRTIRGLPIVTEIAVRYTRRGGAADRTESSVACRIGCATEWLRSGLPLSQSNIGLRRRQRRDAQISHHAAASGIVRPATPWPRWRAGASARGQDRAAVFLRRWRQSASAEQWDGLRAKWTHVHALTNVWREPPAQGAERYSRPRGGRRAARQSKAAGADGAANSRLERRRRRRLGAVRRADVGQRRGAAAGPTARMRRKSTPTISRPAPRDCGPNWRRPPTERPS